MSSESITLSSVSGTHTLSGAFALTQVAGSFTETDTFSGSGDQQIPAGSFTETDSITGDFNRFVSAGSFIETDSLAGAGETLDFSNAITLFKFVLTGAEDSTTDIEMPITSFQMRMYDDAATYLSVVIPGITYAASVAARSNGNLELYMSYASVSGVEIVRSRIIAVSFDIPDINNGAENKSITLSGHETTAQKNERLANTKTVTLDDSWFNYLRTNNGLVSGRMVKPHLTLSAGDTVVTDSGTFTANRITWMKSENVHYMEVAEAA